MSIKELPKGAPLFRKEVILHRAEALFGAILIPSIRAIDVLTAVSVALVAALIMIVFSASYAQRVRASGWLSTDPGPARIETSSPGVVSGVHVRDGDTVARGQALVSLSNVRSSSGISNVDGAVRGQLRLERDELVNQRALQVQLAQSDLSKARAEQAHIRTALEDLSVTKLLVEERARLTQAEWERTQELASRGLLAKVSVERARDAMLAATSAVQDVARQRSEKLLAARALSTEIGNAPVQLEQQRSQLNAAIARIDQRLMENESASDAVIVAPIDGQVTGLSVHLGQSVRAGDLVVTLVPPGAKLHAALLIPSRAAGTVKPGLEVVVRYDAFPHHRFGQYKGTVLEVGETTLSVGDRVGAGLVAEPSYLARITLESDRVSANGKEFLLRSGLTLQAEIVQEKKTVAAWVMDPLADSFGRLR